VLVFSEELPMAIESVPAASPETKSGTFKAKNVVVLIINALYMREIGGCPFEPKHSSSLPLVRCLIL
jgi:hypothetical protein